MQKSSILGELCLTLVETSPKIGPSEMRYVKAHWNHTTANAFRAVFLNWWLATPRWGRGAVWIEWVATWRLGTTTCVVRLQLWRSSVAVRATAAGLLRCDGFLGDCSLLWALWSPSGLQWPAAVSSWPAGRHLCTNPLQMLHHRLNFAADPPLLFKLPSACPPSAQTPWYSGIRSSRVGAGEGAGSGLAMMSYWCHLRVGGWGPCSQKPNRWVMGVFGGRMCVFTTGSKVRDPHSAASDTHTHTAPPAEWRGGYESELWGGGGGVGVFCGSLCPYMGSIRLGVSWPVGNAAGFLACLPTLCIKRETADAQHTNAHFQVRVQSLRRLTKAGMRFESVGSEVCEVAQQHHLTCVVQQCHLCGRASVTLVCCGTFRFLFHPGKI